MPRFRGVTTMPDTALSPVTSNHIPARILIVENEFLIAQLIDDMVTELGYSVVGVATTVAAALKAFAELDFDAVLLDINLNGHRNPETADFLLQRGIPFAFVSGYDNVSQPHLAHVPLVLKPFSDEEIGVALRILVGPARGALEPRRA
jgi:CheY-like chemotaxis protein